MGRFAAYEMADEDEEKPPAVVKLISSEGHEFVIEREAAMVSGTIKNMLSSPVMFVESSGEIRFPEISSVVLEKVCQYFHHKLKFTNNNSTAGLPDFLVEPEIALNLLMAANYLDT